MYLYSTPEPVSISYACESGTSGIQTVPFYATSQVDIIQPDNVCPIHPYYNTNVSSFSLKTELDDASSPFHLGFNSPTHMAPTHQESRSTQTETKFGDSHNYSLQKNAIKFLPLCEYSTMCLSAVMDQQLFRYTILLQMLCHLFIHPQQWNPCLLLSSTTCLSFDILNTPNIISMAPFSTPIIPEAVIFSTDSSLQFGTIDSLH